MYILRNNLSFADAQFQQVSYTSTLYGFNITMQNVVILSNVHSTKLFHVISE